MKINVISKSVLKSLKFYEIRLQSGKMPFMHLVILFAEVFCFWNNSDEKNEREKKYFKCDGETKYYRNRITRRKRLVSSKTLQACFSFCGIENDWNNLSRRPHSQTNYNQNWLLTVTTRPYSHHSTDTKFWRGLITTQRRFFSYWLLT